VALGWELKTPQGIEALLVHSNTLHSHD
jgi:hypothetical protein